MDSPSGMGMIAPTLLLVLPLALAGAVAGVSYAAFCWHGRGSRSRLLDRACPGRARACLARGVVSALVAQVIMIVAYPLGPLLDSARPQAGAAGAARCGAAPATSGQPGPARSGAMPPVTGQSRAGRPGRTLPGPGPRAWLPPVVVCLHGLYHNPSAFWRIRMALGRAGFSRILIPGYASIGSDFETEAGRLAERLRRLAPGEVPLCFLGHSLGGLMARRLAAEPDFAGRTLAVVSLGTPHRGSALARLAMGRLGRGLVPGSALLARLETLSDPPGALLVALASPVDNLVVPDAGLDPDRPGWRLELTAPVSHVAMLYAGSTVDRAVALLAAAAHPRRG